MLCGVYSTCILRTQHYIVRHTISLSLTELCCRYSRVLFPRLIGLTKRSTTLWFQQTMRQFVLLPWTANSQYIHDSLLSFRRLWWTVPPSRVCLHALSPWPSTTSARKVFRWEEKQTFLEVDFVKFFQCQSVNAHKLSLFICWIFTVLWV